MGCHYPYAVEDTLNGGHELDYTRQRRWLLRCHRLYLRTALVAFVVVVPSVEELAGCFFFLSHWFMNSSNRGSRLTYLSKIKPTCRLSRTVTGDRGYTCSRFRGR